MMNGNDASVSAPAAGAVPKRKGMSTTTVTKIVPTSSSSSFRTFNSLPTKGEVCNGNGTYISGFANPFCKPLPVLTQTNSGTQSGIGGVTLTHFAPTLDNSSHIDNDSIHTILTNILSTPGTTGTTVPTKIDAISTNDQSVPTPLISPQSPFSEMHSSKTMNLPFSESSGQDQILISTAPCIITDEKGNVSKTDCEKQNGYNGLDLSVPTNEMSTASNNNIANIQDNLYYNESMISGDTLNSQVSRSNKYKTKSPPALVISAEDFFSDPPPMSVHLERAPNLQYVGIDTRSSNDSLLVAFNQTVGDDVFATGKPDGDYEHDSRYQNTFLHVSQPIYDDPHEDNIDDRRISEYYYKQRSPQAGELHSYTPHSDGFYPADISTDSSHALAYTPSPSSTGPVLRNKSFFGESIVQSTIHHALPNNVSKIDENPYNISSDSDDENPRNQNGQISHQNGEAYPLEIGSRTKAVPLLENIYPPYNRNNALESNADGGSAKSYDTDGYNQNFSSDVNDTTDGGNGYQESYYYHDQQPQEQYQQEYPTPHEEHHWDGGYYQEQYTESEDYYGYDYSEYTSDPHGDDQQDYYYSSQAHNQATVLDVDQNYYEGYQYDHSQYENQEYYSNQEYVTQEEYSQQDGGYAYNGYADYENDYSSHQEYTEYPNDNITPAFTQDQTYAYDQHRHLQDEQLSRNSQFAAIETSDGSGFTQQNPLFVVEEIHQQRNSPKSIESEVVLPIPMTVNTSKGKAQFFNPARQTQNYPQLQQVVTSRSGLGHGNSSDGANGPSIQKSLSSNSQDDISIITVNSTPMSNIDHGSSIPTAIGSIDNASEEEKKRRHLQVWEKFFENAIASRLGGTGEDDTGSLQSNGSSNANRIASLKDLVISAANNGNGNEINAFTRHSIVFHANESKKYFVVPPFYGIPLSTSSRTLSSQQANVDLLRETSFPSMISHKRYQLLVAYAKAIGNSHELKENSISYLGLFGSIVSNDLPTFQYFIGLGLNVNVCDEVGRSIAFYAVFYHVDVDFLSLCNDNDVNFDHVDQQGNSLLHLAVFHGKTEIVDFLLQCAVDWSIKNREGLTALDLARQIRRHKVIHLLEAAEDLPLTEFADDDHVIESPDWKRSKELKDKDDDKIATKTEIIKDDDKKKSKRSSSSNKTRAKSGDRDNKIQSILVAGEDRSHSIPHSYTTESPYQDKGLSSSSSLLAEIVDEALASSKPPKPPGTSSLNISKPKSSLNEVLQVRDSLLASTAANRKKDSDDRKGSINDGPEDDVSELGSDMEDHVGDDDENLDGEMPKSNIYDRLAGYVLAFVISMLNVTLAYLTNRPNTSQNRINSSGGRHDAKRSHENTSKLVEHHIVSPTKETNNRIRGVSTDYSDSDSDPSKFFSFDGHNYIKNFTPRLDETTCPTN